MGAFEKESQGLLVLIFFMEIETIADSFCIRILYEFPEGCIDWTGLKCVR